MFGRMILTLVFCTQAFLCFAGQETIYLAAGEQGLDPFTSKFVNGRFVPIVPERQKPPRGLIEKRIIFP
ncbi:MAG: hypothetical protein JXB23_18525 [Candidatus Aminicenantes bacterium]|nr:hypothetical protein [Candidatus Aminicenantes bacterium]